MSFAFRFEQCQQKNSFSISLMTLMENYYPLLMSLLMKFIFLKSKSNNSDFLSNYTPHHGKESQPLLAVIFIQAVFSFSWQLVRFPYIGQAFSDCHASAVQALKACPLLSLWLYAPHSSWHNPHGLFSVRPASP